jgi:hypothetical protein
MPTAGRLAGALTFGLLAWYVSWLTAPLFPSAVVPDNWFMFNLVLGLLTGWMTVGPRSGEGIVSAVGVGVTGAVVLGFWILFVHSFRDMIGKSFRKIYDSGIEAVVDIFGIMIKDYILEIGTMPVIAALLGWGIAAGLVTDYFAKRYS